MSRTSTGGPFARVARIKWKESASVSDKSKFLRDIYERGFIAVPFRKDGRTGSSHARCSHWTVRMFGAGRE